MDLNTTEILEVLTTWTRTRSPSTSWDMAVNTSVDHEHVTTTWVEIHEETSHADPNITAENESCSSWIEPQHVIYQLGCLALALSFLTPHTFCNHVLMSRGGMVLGSLLVVLWSGVVVCHKDALAWYVVLCIVNLTHCGFWLVCNWPVSIHSELEELYTKMFRPLRMTRTQFSELVSVSYIRHLPCGAMYAVEDNTVVGQKLSILLSGRLKVTCDNLFLHMVEPLQFVDSVEYDSRIERPEEGCHDKFQVSIRAMEDSRLCVFETEHLQNIVHEKPYSTCVISTLLGKDITHKLYQVQEMLLSHPEYIRILANRNSLVQLRDNINYQYHGSEVDGSRNGILRTTSPPGSAASSEGSRAAVPACCVQITTPSHPQQSRLCDETCV